MILRTRPQAISHILSMMFLIAVLVPTQSMAAKRIVKKKVPRAQVRGNPAGRMTAGEYRISLRHDGQVREMMIRLPRNYDPRHKYPVIFGFHGASGPMAAYHRLLQFLVEEAGVISVSPQGLTSKKAGVAMWNGFPRHRVGNVDDVGLVQVALEYLAQKASIDRARVYATGGSSGAILCFRLALETDIFAGIAPMRGGMSDRLPVPEGRPQIPILLVCGGDDELFINGRSEGEGFHSARKTMALWAANHGADGKVESVLQDSQQVVVTRFGNPTERYDLQLYVAKGLGHGMTTTAMRQALEYMGEFFKLPLRNR